MPGIQLHHPDLRSCVYTLVHEGRALREPIDCPLCGTVHFHKTYHLALNQHGNVIVSELVFERLKEAGLDELVVRKEIAQPPAQKVGMAPTRKNLTVVARETMSRPQKHLV